MEVEVIWEIQVKAQAEKAIDHGNYFGIRYGAEIEWDRFDHVEPPPIGEYVSVYFPHTEWKQYPYNYTTDFKPPDSDKLWDFNVISNISKEEVTVEFIG